MADAIADRGDHAEILAIEGAKMSAVTFVQDYIQLHFDGPTITTITLPEVIVGNDKWNASMSGYKDALCRQIAKVVKRGLVKPNDRLQIEFTDESLVTVSLRTEDYVAAEAIIFRGDGTSQQWAAW
jgi:hypothetical protein